MVGLWFFVHAVNKLLTWAFLFAFFSTRGKRQLVASGCAIVFVFALFNSSIEAGALILGPP
jgi:diacylglycerol kinase